MAMPTEKTPKAPAVPQRRSFFELLTILVGAVATLALAIPLVGYLLGPLLKKKETPTVDLGPVTDYPVGETRLKNFDNPIRQPWDGMTANTGVYVRRLREDAEQKGAFQIFAINCAHLGCPVTWFPQSGLFMCPCHGGVYYANGDHASGPPPRGLFQINPKVNNGRLYIEAPHLPTLQDTLRKGDG